MTKLQTLERNLRASEHTIRTLNDKLSFELNRARYLRKLIAQRKREDTLSSPEKCLSN